MNTLSLVDPGLRPLLDLWPTVELTAETLPMIRDRRLPFAQVDAAGTTLERRHVAGNEGAPDVQLHIYKPIDVTGPLPCIYHIHGGGYVAGAAENLEAFHRPLVAELGCVLVSVDYRLAPETPHPGPIEDCYAGLVWLKANAADLGVDPARIGVMGESAGGGLAAALALLVRDRGDHTLAFQHLVYPMLDDRTCLAETHPYAGEFIWTAASNHFGWTSLLGQQPGTENVSCYAAPARATDLAGLPPTFISTGALDLFVDEDVIYAQRLIRAGVATELHVYPGAFHGFDVAPGPRVADQARADSMCALRRTLEKQ